MWDKDGFKVSKDCSDTRFVVVEGKWSLEDMEEVLINVYAPNILTDQKMLWDILYMI